MTTVVQNSAKNGHQPFDPASEDLSVMPLAHVTLQTYALGAIASQVLDTNAPDNNSLSPELQFLQQQYQRLLEPGNSPQPWHHTLMEYIQRPNSIDRPLVELAQHLDLSLMELLTVAIAAAVEQDLMVGRAIAYLQAPVGGSRPTLGLLATAFADIAPDTSFPIHQLTTGAAIQSGLLQRLNQDAPLPEQVLRIPEHLGLALYAQDGYCAQTQIGIDETQYISLAASITATAHRYALTLQSSSVSAFETQHTSQRLLILRTGSVAEGKSVAMAIAHSLQCRPLFIQAEPPVGLAPWLLLRQLVPVFCLNLAPGERKILPTIPHYQGPILAICGPDGSVETELGTALSWTIPVPDRKDREALWTNALGDGELASTLAQEHRHRCSRIAQLGTLAQQQCQLAGRDRPTATDIALAAWQGEGVRLDALAQPLPDRIDAKALVMTRKLHQELTLLLLRCRARDGLVDGLGRSAAARYYPGVRALFVGPSGTGKTLAASWLATQLNMPLYRVDLAAINSKYIGETEKNLAQLLARAEQAEVILLFDEADSLFGKRTEVQQANDRHANAQTNYLLQRIESYDGITILTSNSRNRFDDAFSRRLDAVLEFDSPGPNQRKALWKNHLGDRHQISTTELNQLAASADLNGGNIRNVVFAAAVLTKAENRTINYGDILQGLKEEYRKLGQQMPGILKRQA